MFKYLVIILLLLTSCTTKNIVLQDAELLFKNNKIILKENGEKYKINIEEKFVGDINYVINNNDVFITSLTKNLIKLSLTNKKLEWTKKLSTIPQNNFVFKDGYIFFNGVDNNFYILNYNTGDIENIIFNTNTKTVVENRKPYFYGNKIVVFFNNNEVYIVNTDG